MEANGLADSLRFDHINEPIAMVGVLITSGAVPAQGEPKLPASEWDHRGPALCGCDHQCLMLVPLEIGDPDAACCALSKPAGRGRALQLLASRWGREDNRLDEHALDARKRGASKHLFKASTGVSHRLLDCRVVLRLGRRCTRRRCSCRGAANCRRGRATRGNARDREPCGSRSRGSRRLVQEPAPAQHHERGDGADSPTHVTERRSFQSFAWRDNYTHRRTRPAG